MFTVEKSSFELTAHDFKTKYLPDHATKNEMLAAAYENMNRTGNYDADIIGEYSDKEEAMKVAGKIHITPAHRVNNPVPFISADYIVVNEYKDECLYGTWLEEISEYTEG